jgi:hypothetical protein
LTQGDNDNGARLTAVENRVQGYAELGVHVLRTQGITDAEILRVYTAPHPDDAEFEAAQARNGEEVVAPAAQVKAAMKRLLTATVAA